MRSWQRSATVCIRTPVLSVTRSVASRLGLAAYGSATAAVQANPSWGISAFLFWGWQLAGPVADVGEEGVDPLPCLAAAVEALPVHPDQPDQLVADVDRHQQEVRHPADLAQQQRLDVELHLGRQPGAAKALFPGVHR